MANPELDKSIKLTQEVLGKYVKKPPLSEKNLARPPFRFLHDIVTSVQPNSGFLNGVFEQSELDPGNITTREAKTEFMRKLIAAIKDVTGEEVSVKISKVLAGQEPEKTNQLLQSLAKAIEKSGGGGKPAKATASKTGGGAAAATKKPTVEKKSDSKAVTNKPDAKGVAGKKGATPAATAPSKDSTKGSKRAPTKAAGTGTTKPAKVPSDTTTAKKTEEKITSVSEDKKPQKSSSLQRQNSKLNQLGQVEDGESKATENGKNLLGNTQPSSDVGIAHDDHIELYNDFKNSSMIPNGETLPLPSAPLISDSSAMLSMTSINVDNHEDIPDFSSSLDNNAKTKSSALLDHKNDEVGGGDAMGSFGSTITENPVASTSRNRPGTGSRLGTARPPSARPAPPRPRSSMPKDAEESNYRPPTGKVTNVLMDTSDAVDDDDNFIIRETSVSKGSGLADLDEAPELMLTGGSKNSEVNLDDLDPGQRGLLVNQILESQKELESKINENKENEKLMGSKDFDPKSRESSKAEIEKLKALLQDCARNANPLGKLLDYVREDIDAMQKEVGKWREESHQLDTELDKAKKSKEASLQPLQQELHEVETRIADKEDAIAATKMSILRHQERIEKILSGLDRVQSSHGKISLPSASQLMEEPATSIMRGGDDYQDGSHSSGFGATLNRFAKSSAGMRPISLFAATDELEDPDNFDPWKA